jgi:hypothetical protein
VDPESFDQYKEVQLSEEEQNAALFQARQKKYFDNKVIEYNKKLTEESEIVKLTPKQLYQNVFDAGFEMDAYNKQIIWNLCRYFAGDPNGPYNLRKGIMLYGPVGCYKTSLMRFFKKNQSNGFVVFHVNDISMKFTKEGHEAIQRYKGFIETADVKENFGQKQLGICFDDFGTEVDKKFYGNESNVMAEIILCRHMDHERLMSKTHFTTNLSADAIQERYGERVKSRLREMVNLVAFPDDTPDRRK